MTIPGSNYFRRKRQDFRAEQKYLSSEQCKITFHPIITTFSRSPFYPAMGVLIWFSDNQGEPIPWTPVFSSGYILQVQLPSRTNILNSMWCTLAYLISRLIPSPINVSQGMLFCLNSIKPLYWRSQANNLVSTGVTLFVIIDQNCQDWVTIITTSWSWMALVTVQVTIANLVKDNGENTWKSVMTVGLIAKQHQESYSVI